MSRHDPNTEPGRGAHIAPRPRVPTTGNLPADGADPEVDHPTHYNMHPSGIETIDLIEHLSLNVGTAMKYLMRADHKGKYGQDLDKSRWYLRREIDRLTRGGTPSTKPPETAWMKVITGEPDPKIRMIFRLVRSGTYIPAVAILDELIARRVTNA